MNKKKIIYIVLLVVVLIIIGGFVLFTATRDGRLTINKSTNLGNKSSSSQTIDNGLKSTTVTTLDDGVLYSITDEKIQPDIVIGDNYFDTQMADINLNFSKYNGKTIEIEGMSLSNDPYTFVGRYSTANLCAACPTGYSYMEYTWKGDQTPELVEGETWLKVIGTLTRGKDAGVEYYYIDVQSIEVMNEAGLKTVNN